MLDRPHQRTVDRERARDPADRVRDRISNAQWRTDIVARDAHQVLRILITVNQGLVCLSPFG